MEKLEKLYEGKAKQLYATDDPEVLWVEYKNSATAGDGEKKEDFAGKGRLNNLITTLIFDLLKKRGIDSHLVARVGETSQLVKKVTMFPLEIVLRNTAAGHFCSRLGVKEGIELKEPVLEYFLKNDDLHDPFVNDDDLVALGVCTREDLAEIAPLARRINEALIEIFAKIDVKLVDFKIEMGRTSDGTLLLADEITPDSCRLWDQRDHSGKVEHLDKDLFRRALGDIYRQRLAGLDGLRLLQTDPQDFVVPHIVCVRVLNGRKDELKAALSAAGIPVGVHYKPNHLLSLFRPAPGSLPLPVTEQLYGELVTLPMHPGLSAADVEHICDVITATLA